MNEITAIEAPVTSSLEDSSVTHAVVQAVANAKGVSPIDLHPPLYSTVDTDALDQLVNDSSGKPADAALEIRFQYCGFDVTVSGDGSVSLEN